MLLTTVNEQQAPEEARYLLERSSTEQPETTSRAIIDLITRTYAKQNCHCDRNVV